MSKTEQYKYSWETHVLAHMGRKMAPPVFLHIYLSVKFCCVTEIYRIPNPSFPNNISTILYYYVTSSNLFFLNSLLWAPAEIMQLGYQFTYREFIRKSVHAPTPSL